MTWLSFGKPSKKQMDDLNKETAKIFRQCFLEQVEGQSPKVVYLCCCLWFGRPYKEVMAYEGFTEEERDTAHSIMMTLNSMGLG